MTPLTETQVQGLRKAEKGEIRISICRTFLCADVVNVRTAHALARRALLESSGVCKYRLTEAGRAALAALEKK